MRRLLPFLLVSATACSSLSTGLYDFLPGKDDADTSEPDGETDEDDGGAQETGWPEIETGDKDTGTPSGGPVNPGDSTPIDTDTGTPALTDFVPVEFYYTLQMGLGRDASVSNFAFNGTVFGTGIFITLLDATGAECSFGYLVDGGLVSAVPGTTLGNLQPTPTGLASWLNTNNLPAGFVVAQGSYTAVPLDCTLDASIPWASDPHTEFLTNPANGNSKPMYVGIARTLSTDWDTVLSGISGLTPAKSYWTGGKLRVPYQVTSSSGTTDVLDLAKRVIEVDSGMSAVQSGGSPVYIPRSDMFAVPGNNATWGIWLGDSFLITL